MNKSRFIQKNDVSKKNKGRKTKMNFLEQKWPYHDICWNMFVFKRTEWGVSVYLNVLVDDEDAWVMEIFM